MIVPIRLTDLETTERHAEPWADRIARAIRTEFKLGEALDSNAIAIALGHVAKLILLVYDEPSLELWEAICRAQGASTLPAIDPGDRRRIRRRSSAPQIPLEGPTARAKPQAVIFVASDMHHASLVRDAGLSP